MDPMIDLVRHRTEELRRVARAVRREQELQTALSTSAESPAPTPTPTPEERCVDQMGSSAKTPAMTAATADM